ncbi:MAG: hypothetical protein FJ267_06480, partial [Planctomycetes bacterium]|nr:hypothetical protein [Planctomycetota bacterium]
MQATGFSTGWIEYFLILIGGSGFLGMPGGHHDVSVRQAAPRQSLVYLEWSSRSSGKQGSPGFEGLMADPEIRPLLESFTDHIQAEDQIPAPGDNGNVFADFEDSRRQWLALVQQLTADPGCLFLSLEPPKKEVGGAGGFLKNALANVVGFQSRIRLGVVLSPQQHPDHLLDSISRMTDADIGPNPDMKVVSFKNPAYTITVHQIGQRIILGYGNGTVTAVMECLEGRAPSIESNPRFQESVKRLQLANTSNVGWIDVHETVQTAVRLVGPAGALIPIVLRATSLDVLDSITSTSGIVDGDIIQRVYLSTGGTTSGLFALAGGPALGSEQLSHIPSDCDLVLAGSVDLGKVIHSVRDLLYQVTPVSAKVFDEAIKQMEGELGLKLDADILQALGTTLTLFDSPTYGGTLGSSAILAVEVRDPGRAALIYERFLSHLEQSFVDRSNGGDRQTSGLSPDYEIRQQS